MNDGSLGGHRFHPFHFLASLQSRLVLSVSLFHPVALPLCPLALPLQFGSMLIPTDSAPTSTHCAALFPTLLFY
jgi:hypothetical protein